MLILRPLLRWGSAVLNRHVKHVYIILTLASLDHRLQYIVTFIVYCVSVCGATRQLCASACARRRRRRRSQRYLAPDRWLHLCRSRGLSSSRKLAPIAAISAGRAAVHSGTRSRRRRRLGVAVRPSTGPGGRRAVSVGGRAGGVTAAVRGGVSRWRRCALALKGNITPLGQYAQTTHDSRRGVSRPSPRLLGTRFGSNRCALWYAKYS